MKDNQIKKETIDLCKKFITAGFLELRKTGEYERYRKYMFGKNIPEFLSKYFERAGEKLEFDERVQNIIQTTGATEKEIKQVLQNGYTITECLSLFSKKL